jgi:hypothetical protein
MSVAPQIAQHLHGTAKGWLGIDDPILAVQTAKELSELPGIGQRSGRACTMEFLAAVKAFQEAGIDKATLERWLAGGKIARPKSLRIGEKEFRDWSNADVERVRKYKQENYRKGRGRKPKPKR